MNLSSEYDIIVVGAGVAGVDVFDVDEFGEKEEDPGSDDEGENYSQVEAGFEFVFEDEFEGDKEGYET